MAKKSLNINISVVYPGGSFVDGIEFSQECLMDNKADVNQCVIILLESWAKRINENINA